MDLFFKVVNRSKGFSYLILNLFLWFQLEALPQGYGFFPYNDEAGLTSNLVKTVVQDSGGYIWLGTDAGIVKYDGRAFTSQTRGFPTIYIKDLLRTRDDKLILVSDLGVGYVKPIKNKFIYEEILKGNTSLTDTGLFYPKAIYQTRDGSFWISDHNGIIHFNEGMFKKYPFDEKYFTDSYFRSFIIVEDEEGNLIASSWKGSLFRYDKLMDKFIILPYKQISPENYINQLTLIEQGKLLLGTRYGIDEVTYSNDFKEIETKRLVSLEQVSSFYKNRSGNYIVGTWNNGAFLWEPDRNRLIKLNELSSNTINNIYEDREKGIWICTDDGLALLKENPFSKAEFEQDSSNRGSYFIRNLIVDEKNDVYFSDQERIFKVEFKGKTKNYLPIHDSRGKRVYSFSIRNGEMGISYRNGELTLLRANRIKTFNQRELGGRVTSMLIDDHGNYWGFVELANKVIRIDESFDKSYYNFPAGSNNSQILQRDKNGNIYFLYAEYEFNIFRFNPAEDGFEKYEFSEEKRFDNIAILFDFKIEKEELFYIASSKGLFELKNKRIQNISENNLNFGNSVFKAIFTAPNGNMWIGTEKELLYRLGEQIISFSRQDGLQNSVVTQGGIVIDKNNRIWVATSNGLAFWQADEFIINKTPKPSLIRVVINEETFFGPERIPEFTGNVNLEILYSAVTYPNRIKYQTRLIGIKNEWSEHVKDNKSEFFNLPPGEYIYQLRAQQAGNLWSDIREFKFVVVSPWYLRWWAIITFITLFLFLLITSANIVSARRVRRIEREKQKLEEIVYEKTRALQAEKEITENLLAETQSAKSELERTNEDLKKANELKSDLLSIAAHDLKNPLSSILGFAELLKEENLSEEEKKHFVEVVIQAAHNMRKLINDILDSVVIESTRFKLEFSRVDLTELVDKIIQLNSTRASQKKQRIHFLIKADVVINVDPKWIRQAIDNIISNAVKYSPISADIYVELKKVENRARFSCKDGGPGLTELDKSQLFGKFQRLSAKPTGGESSTGLGLSIVKEIVELHSGEIRVESEYGKGSTFIIELPITDVRKTNA